MADDVSRLDALFARALDLDADARQHFLVEACGDDDSLRAELESLLDAHARAGAFIREPAFRSGLSLLQEASLPADTRVGPYAIRRELGRGGMGVVYLAERADAAYQKQVAIKVMRVGLDSETMRQRFQHERQILASLDHPNIARLLDAGTTADGHPYVVMEYVDGVAITDYCERQALTIDDRVRLFRKVCAAVQHAHQNLIVHRDLKPGNILVTADGEPKLLDFGIAKLLDQDDADLTRTHMRLLTPDYASPEQIRGLPITTISDVYSLGVVLYVTLSGARPYHLEGDDAGLGQALDGTATTRPSLRVDATDPRRLALTGDLDNIVLMAMRAEPARRYGSAAELSLDLSRYLDGLPIVARGDTFGYLAGKFIRRHKAGVVAAAVVVASLVGGMVAAGISAREARRQQERAERRFADVRRLANSFMFEIHDAIVDVPGTTAARALMVGKAVEYLDSLASEAGSDASLQRELASAYIKVGDAQGHPTSANIGDSTGAGRSYRKAVTMAEALLAQAPDDGDARLTLARAHRQLADLQAWTGDIAGGVSRTRASRDLYVALANDTAADSEAWFQAGIAEIKLGDLLGNENFPNAGEAAPAVEAYHRALPIFASMAARRPDDERVMRYLGLVHERLGQMAETAADYEGALAEYRESYTSRAVLAARQPLHGDVQRDYAIAHEKIGNVLRATGNLAGALDEYRASFAVFDRLAAADPSNAIAARSLAISYEQIANTLRLTHRPLDAVPMYRKAIAIQSGLIARDAANAQAREDLAELQRLLDDTQAVPSGSAQPAGRRD